MKKPISVALMLLLVLSLFAGCRSRQEDETTTGGTTEATSNMMPATGDILPDPHDTVAPSSGANRDDTSDTTETTVGMDDTTGNSAENDGLGRSRHPMR